MIVKLCSCAVYGSVYQDNDGNVVIMIMLIFYWMFKGYKFVGYRSNGNNTMYGWWYVGGEIIKVMFCNNEEFEFSRILFMLDMKQIQRHYFKPDSPIPIPKHQ